MTVLPLIFSLMASVSGAHAAGSDPGIESATLEDLLNIKVVTASRREEDSAMAPATIRVITQKDIEDHGYKDLKDIFRDLPGFDVSEDLTGEVRTDAIARGLLGENKLLVLKDGKRLNATTGERLVLGNNMPLFNVKRIEVMYGPGSVLYGADAYSGVVNIITKDYDDIKGDGKTGGVADVSYGLNNTADIGLMAGTKVAEGIDTTWSLRLFNSDGTNPTNYKDFDNYHMAYNQPVSDYEFYSRTRIGQAQLTLYRQDAKEPGGQSTNPALFDFNKKYVWHQKQDKVYFDHTLKGADWELQSTIGYEDYEIAPESNFQYTPANDGPAYKYGRNMAVSLEEKLDNRFTEKFSLTSGILVERVDAFAKGNNLKSPYNSSDLSDTITYPNDSTIPTDYRGKTLNFGPRPYTDAGVFSEGKYKFTDHLIANLGMRYDYNSDYYGVYTPRAGAVYELNSRWLTKLLYSEAYIKPSRYQAFEHWTAGDTGSGPTFGYYPNPQLKPERLKTVQWDIQSKVSSSFVVTLNTYINWVQDLIAPANDGAWNHNANKGSQRTYGDELLLDYQASNALRAHLYFTELRGVQALDAPINKTADNKINAGLTYTVGAVSLTPSLRWSDHVHIIDPTQTDGVGHINDYMVVDFAARWRGLFKGADAYLTVHNVFDRKYYGAEPFGEGPEGWLESEAPQPGREGEVGLAYTF